MLELSCEKESYQKINSICLPPQLKRDKHQPCAESKSLSDQHKVAPSSTLTTSSPHREATTNKLRKTQSTGPALGGTTGPREAICKMIQKMQTAARACSLQLRRAVATARSFKGDGVKTELGVEIETLVLSFTFSFLFSPSCQTLNKNPPRTDKISHEVSIASPHARHPPLGLPVCSLVGFIIQCLDPQINDSCQPRLFHAGVRGDATFKQLDRRSRQRSSSKVRCGGKCTATPPLAIRDVNPHLGLSVWSAWDRPGSQTPRRSCGSALDPRFRVGNSSARKSRMSKSVSKEGG